MLIHVLEFLGGFVAAVLIVGVYYSLTVGPYLLGRRFKRKKNRRKR